MIYCFDLDGTICTLVENSRYQVALPFLDMVEKVCDLYDDGHTIKIFTARGCNSGIDHTELTKKQLKLWGVKYHELIMNKKPHYDLLVDDKAVEASRWRMENGVGVTGVIAGSFDVIHPGYMRMFRDAKRHCDHLTICLHHDPSQQNSKKIQPILLPEERKEILLGIQYIDKIEFYQTEPELETLLKQNRFQVRIVGSDYLEKPITGGHYSDRIVYHERNHQWSATKFKEKIYKNYASHTGALK